MAFSSEEIGLEQQRIVSVSVPEENLFIFCENLGRGAEIMLNGEEQQIRDDARTPETALIGKKAGKEIKPVNRLRVQIPTAHSHWRDTRRS